MDSEDLLLQECRELIEKKIGWNDSPSWTNHDFEMLSDKIQQDTGVNLSIATLKRIWGKVKYDSKPTVTTLNTLAKFIGFANWREFRNSRQREGEAKQEEPLTKSPQSIDTASRSAAKFVKPGLIGTALCSVIILFIVYGFRDTSVKPAKAYSFSSKKVVSEGVPNSVIFDYDASNAPSDCVFIQQSWDERLRSKVSKQQHQHTSIYYTPGFFQAKLLVNNEVVREHNLMITSKDWIALVKQNGPVPVYFRDEDFRKGQMLSVSPETARAKDIPFEPELPIISFYNVRDFGDIRTDNFSLETRIRNDYNEGSGACQFSQILLLTEGDVIILPLSVKGCVSDIDLYFNSTRVDGKANDLSKFGCDLSQWVNVKCQVQKQRGQIYINDTLAYESPWDTSQKIVGIIYRFQGAGSIDYVKLASNDNEYVFEDQF